MVQSKSVFARATGDCDTEIAVARSCGDTVSGITMAVRRLLVTETTPNVFWSGETPAET